jgi:hypothetical protein
MNFVVKCGNNLEKDWRCAERSKVDFVGEPKHLCQKRQIAALSVGIGKALKQVNVGVVVDADVVVLTCHREDLPDLGSSSRRLPVGEST